jgi:NifU-like protein involved in Fe-S cluster formation
MSRINDLLSRPLEVVNVGIDMFREDLNEQDVKVAQVNFLPPADGDLEVLDALDYLDTPGIREKVEAANKEAVERIVNSHPVLIGYEKAIDVIPGMTPNMIIHAGPPIEWKDMCGAMKGAVTGAIVFEGLAKDIAEAEEVAASGKIVFSPCHEHDTVGSMAGVTSPSMYVHVVKNKTYGNISYTNLSEQLSKILRMGANDQSVIDRLIWMRDVFGPILKEAMEIAGEIDLKLMLSQAIHMGDECHNRNVAGTTLLIQALTPHIVKTSFSEQDKVDVFNFVASSDYFSGPTWMALCKNAMDSAHGIEYSTIVTTMCRNGVEFGVRVSGMEGNTWFTGPAQKVIGPLFAGFKPEDSGLDIGDSAITETYGIGGFAMSAALAIVSLVGGTVSDAISYTKKMGEITTGENPNVTIPILNFRGIPTGIDIRKVLETGMLPVINTAIAHKDAGVGMIGAGITNPPMDCFKKAALELAARVRVLESQA